MIIIIVLEGGFHDGIFFDAILEYDVASDTFTQIGTMNQARRDHAVSVVKYKDFSEWCDEIVNV